MTSGTAEARPVRPPIPCPDRHEIVAAVWHLQDRIIVHENRTVGF
jgi:hypothetical protein